MWILIVGLIALTLIAMIIGKWYYYRINKKIEKGELQEAPAVVEVDDECCGQHEVCEKDSLLAAVSKGIEYYDDEELDRFRGRASDDYTDEEVEEFREVSEGKLDFTIGSALDLFGGSISYEIVKNL